MLIALAPRTQDLSEKIDIRGANDCWPWTGTRTRYGYGSIRLDKKTVSAHRAVFALTHTINDTMVVRHSCDNPICCNPSHLLAGTQQDNIDDMMKRGRYGRWRKREPREESETFGNHSDAFVIKNKVSGKYLNTKASLFGSIEDAMTFSSHKSAQEMVNTCVHINHRGDFEVVRWRMEIEQAA
jgi:hypothetical protein